MGFFANIWAWMRKHPFLTTILMVAVVLSFITGTVAVIALIFWMLGTINASAGKRALVENKSLEKLFNDVHQHHTDLLFDKIDINDLKEEKFEIILRLDNDVQQYRKSTKAIFSAVDKTWLNNMRDIYRPKAYFDVETMLKKEPIRKNAGSYFGWGVAKINRSILDYLTLYADLLQVRVMYGKPFKNGDYAREILKRIEKAYKLKTFKKGYMDIKYIKKKIEMLRKHVKLYTASEPIPAEKLELEIKRLKNIYVKDLDALKTYLPAEVDPPIEVLMVPEIEDISIESKVDDILSGY